MGVRGLSDYYNPPNNNNGWFSVVISICDTIAMDSMCLWATNCCETILSNIACKKVQVCAPQPPHRVQLKIGMPSN